MTGHFLETMNMTVSAFSVLDQRIVALQYQWPFSSSGARVGGAFFDAEGAGACGHEKRAGVKPALPRIEKATT